MDDQTPNERYLRVDVTGDNPALWQKFRPKLIEAITRLLDTVVDSERDSTVRNELGKFTSALLDHAKARLAKAGLENERIEAEVRRLYSQIEIDHAEARKKHAEAEAIEFDTAVKKLRLVLGTAKAMLTGEEGEEAVVFYRQIEEFLKVLTSLAEPGSTMSQLE